MEQNVIAVIWDFDKTLVRGYMQKPIFEKYKVDESLFWDEVNQLYDKYQEQGINVNKETIYLNHIITCTHQGIFEGLNNSLLRKLGQELEFYEGIPEIFTDLKNKVEKNEKYQKHGITLEHYIVSTGISELIKGSKISKCVDGIWGCEFIEVPIKSNIRGQEEKKDKVDDNKIISQVGYAIDNTTKTRAIFEINKGVNKFEKIDVNSKIPYDMRRVPIQNMIYIADGPSDVPVFSVIKQNGGTTFAVYAEDNEGEFAQVEQLRVDGRVDMYGPANYSKGTLTYMWLNKQSENIAEKIFSRIEHKVLSSVSEPPKHITD